MNMPLFKTKKNVPIKTIYFNDSTSADLTASTKNDANHLKRILNVLALTSGTDGKKKLDVSVQMAEGDIKIIISGNDILTVLKMLSQSKPPTFNQKSIEQIQKMCRQYTSQPSNADAEKAPLLPIKR